MFRKFLVLFLILVACVATPEAHAAFTISNGRLVDADEAPTMSDEGHYNAAAEAFECEDWDEAAKHFKILIVNYKTSPCAKDASYFLGVSYYNLEDYEFANIELTNYLESGCNPVYFEDAIEYKFAIAEEFRNGACRHLFGFKQMPKWASGEKTALKTYDEVIAAMPGHEIAAKALFFKGIMLWGLDEFRDSIDCFQMLIRRFPKNEMAPEAYYIITKIYLDQATVEFQNPDLLALAEINVRRFEQDFPGDPRVASSQTDVDNIKEVYAEGLYEIGLFYERCEKPCASKLYYRKAIRQFPDTEIAELCLDRLSELGDG